MPRVFSEQHRKNLSTALIGRAFSDQHRKNISAALKGRRRPPRKTTMSWKPEVRVNNDPKWYDNAVRLETRAEAEAYAHDLMTRWITAREVRATEVTDPVNGTWIDGKMVWDEDVK
jgi:hypothetical protein